jgi:hypothetical protein
MEKNDGGSRPVSLNRAATARFACAASVSGGRG